MTSGTADPTSGTPAVSVVIPAWNAGMTLGAQLAALRAQVDAPAFEVIVADNGSTDGTASVVAEFQRTWPAVRLVDASRRRGASAARNVGAAHARSGRLLFCDADDVAAAEWVRRMASALAEHEFVAGRVEHALLNPGNDWDVGWAEPTYRESFLPWLPAAGSGNLGIRVDLFRELGGFDETRPSGEDCDLCWRAQLAGHRLAPVPDAVVHVRKRSGLRATITQAYAKGAAVRQLRYDYADVAAAFQRAATERAVAERTTVERPADETDAAPAPPRERLGRLGRAPRRLMRLLRAPHQAMREVGEAAHALGQRFGRIDRTRTTIVPPDDVSPLLDR